jgi:phosphate transport system permease protein
LGLGCAASSVAACWLVFDRFTEGTGWFGFLVVAYIVFVALFYVVTAERLGRLVAFDRTVTVGVWSAAVAVLVPLCGLVLYIVVKGLPGLSLNFFTHSMRGISPMEPATEGGGLAAIVGTLEEVGLALVFSVPLAMGTAVFLNETRSRWRRPVRVFVDAMSGKPSIVAGLFIYAVFILPFAGRSTIFGYNGLMAALALSLTMMPTVARTVEVVLRVVPGGLREAGLAMGSSRARVVWSVVLPTARSGIATAVVLGIARTAGETAPLLWTSFGTTLFNANPFSGPQASLPLFIYSFIREPLANPIQRGETAALVLMVLVLVLFVIARFLGRDRMVARRRTPTARLLGQLRRRAHRDQPLRSLVVPATYPSAQPLAGHANRLIPATYPAVPGSSVVGRRISGEAPAPPVPTRPDDEGTIVVDDPTLSFSLDDLVLEREPIATEPTVVMPADDLVLEHEPIATEPTVVIPADDLVRDLSPDLLEEMPPATPEPPSGAAWPTPRAASPAGAETSSGSGLPPDAPWWPWRSYLPRPTEVERLPDREEPR